MYLFLLSFRAVLEAYGHSQARGRIGAIAPHLCHSHSNISLSHVCDLHHSSQQCQILLNPLSEARDWTRILMDTIWVCLLLSHSGNSHHLCFIIIFCCSLLSCAWALGNAQVSSHFPMNNFQRTYCSQPCFENSPQRILLFFSTWVFLLHCHFLLTSLWNWCCCTQHPLDAFRNLIISQLLCFFPSYYLFKRRHYKLRLLQKWIPASLIKSLIPLNFIYPAIFTGHLLWENRHLPCFFCGFQSSGKDTFMDIVIQWLFTDRYS